MSKDRIVLPLAELTRRSFCAMAGSACVGVALAGCISGEDGQVVGTGALGDENNNGSGGSSGSSGSGGTGGNGGSGGTGGTGGHAGTGGSGGTGGVGGMGGTGGSAGAGTGGTGGAGGSTGPMCASNATAVGMMPSQIPMGSGVVFSSQRVIVGRDSGGLFAMSASCTHSGCVLRLQSSQYYCNCHGATFDLTGGSPTYPAFSSLQHYQVCLVNGNIVVDRSMPVSASTRLPV